MLEDQAPSQSFCFAREFLSKSYHVAFDEFQALKAA
jgi:hypothetical protein